MTNTPENLPIEQPPAARIEHAISVHGEDEVVSRAIALLAGYNVGDEFLLYAGGTHAQGILDGAPPLYWPEVWGARVLMYAWNDSARDAVVAGLGNQAWRVREMSAKVIAARDLKLVDEVTALTSDEVARVRAQAARTLGEIGDENVIELLTTLVGDKDIDVRRQAGAALRTIKQRTGTTDAPTAIAETEPDAAAIPDAEEAVEAEAVETADEETIVEVDEKAEVDEEAAVDDEAAVSPVAEESAVDPNA